MTTRSKKSAKPTPLQKKVKAMAQQCWNRLKRQPVGAAGSKLLAYYTIGRFLKAASPNRSQTYEEKVLTFFIDKWASLGGFPLSAASAKHARQFASAFSNPALRKKAFHAGLTWTEIRRLSKKHVRSERRIDAVEKAWKRKHGHRQTGADR